MFSSLGGVPLTVIENGLHIRVTCDACRRATAELCAKRDLAVTARTKAVPKFKEAGWHHDPGKHGHAITQEHAERDGSGRWYCPRCCQRTHL
jgi:hypothetical protein